MDIKTITAMKSLSGTRFLVKIWYVILPSHTKKSYPDVTEKFFRNLLLLSTTPSHRHNPCTTNISLHLYKPAHIIMLMNTRPLPASSISDPTHLVITIPICWYNSSSYIPRSYNTEAHIHSTNVLFPSFYPPQLHHYTHVNHLLQVSTHVNG